jgi:two-component system, response regulator
MQGKPITLLIAEDDDDDFLLTQKALSRSRVVNDVQRVRDGEELMDYLLRRGAYADPASAPRPVLILLDLNMPRKDGREALREIKADASLRDIPIVVLTTSQAETDVLRTYDLGANSYITKPADLQGLVEALKVIARVWFQVVELHEAGEESA